MRKSEAIDLLGGSVSAAASAIGISYQAVAKWPDDLPPRIADRVIAAKTRMGGRDALQDTRRLNGFDVQENNHA